MVLQVVSKIQSAPFVVGHQSRLQPGLHFTSVTPKRNAKTWFGQYFAAQTASKLIGECHLLL